MDFDALQQLLQQPLYQYYIFVICSFIPVARIFERAGFRIYWTLLLSVPMIGFILVLAVLALRPWRRA